MIDVCSMKEIGSIVRRVRKAQKVNQTILAQATNVGIRLIVDIERGKSTVQCDKSLTAMNRLDIALKVDIPMED